jgi:hypothetical protein
LVDAHEQQQREHEPARDFSSAAIERHDLAIEPMRVVRVSCTSSRLRLRTMAQLDRIDERIGAEECAKAEADRQRRRLANLRRLEQEQERREGPIRWVAIQGEPN